MRICRVGWVLAAVVLACDAASEGTPKERPSGEERSDAEVGAKGDDGHEATEAAGRRFDRSLRKQACALLTPEILAPHAGVSADQIKQRDMKGMCLYRWDGGRAGLMHIRVSDDVEQSKKWFENAYAGMSKADVDATMDQAAAQIDEDAQEGTLDPNVAPEQAKRVASKLGGLMDEGFSFVQVFGVGDQAAFANTRRETTAMGRTVVEYDNEINVRVGNLKFTSFFRPSGEPKLYQEENVELAKSIVAALPVPPSASPASVPHR